MQETHLEVARLALPLFLRRCATLLEALVDADAAADPTASMSATAAHTTRSAGGTPTAAHAASPRSRAPTSPAATVARSRAPAVMHVQEPLAAAASARKVRLQIPGETPAEPAAGDTTSRADSKDVPGQSVTGTGGTAGVADTTTTAAAGAQPLQRPPAAGLDLELLEGLAVVVLQRLAELRVAPEVVDGAIPAATELRMLVERTRRSRGARGAAADTGERTHLFAVYGAVAECAAVRSRAVRAAAVSVLRAVSELLPLGLGMLGT